MNARSYRIDLSVEDQQVDEVALGLFSTIMFHRTSGKIFYGKRGCYTVGAIGVDEFDCNFIDLTYVAVSSPALRGSMKATVSKFSEDLRRNESTGTCEITLEFYQKKPQVKFLYLTEPHISWEMWTIQLNLVRLNTENDRRTHGEHLAEVLSDKVFYITEIMNKPDYVPKVPSEAELGYVFDLTYPDIHPYLHKLYYSIDGNPTATSIPKGFTNMLKDVFF